MVDLVSIKGSLISNNEGMYILECVATLYNCTMYNDLVNIQFILAKVACRLRNFMLWPYEMSTHDSLEVFDINNVPPFAPLKLDNSLTLLGFARY